jgi:hypothetical protein
MEIDDNDSNTIIIIKLSIAFLTVMVMGFSIIRTGFKILKARKKGIGFTSGK